MTARVLADVQLVTPGQSAAFTPLAQFARLMIHLKKLWSTAHASAELCGIMHLDRATT
jgi:hypothetical protein